jgi:hypothetical protein
MPTLGRRKKRDRFDMLILYGAFGFTNEKTFSPGGNRPLAGGPLLKSIADPGQETKSGSEALGPSEPQLSESEALATPKPPPG